MAYWLSNGHVTDRCCLATSYFLITRDLVCFKAVRLAILVTAWLLVWS